MADKYIYKAYAGQDLVIPCEQALLALIQRVPLVLHHLGAILFYSMPGEIFQTVGKADPHPSV